LDIIKFIFNIKCEDHLQYLYGIMYNTTSQCNVFLILIVKYFLVTVRNGWVNLVDWLIYYLQCNKNNFWTIPQKSHCGKIN